MIALDPDFIGSLAPPSKLTTAVNDNHGIPFARLPRLERLRIQGKADETEIDAAAEGIEDADEQEGANANGQKVSNQQREKKKMRGRGKSLKRYLRKQRKNVIDPTAVCITPCAWVLATDRSLGLGCYPRQVRKAARRETYREGDRKGRNNTEEAVRPRPFQTSMTLRILLRIKSGPLGLAHFRLPWSAASTTQFSLPMRSATGHVFCR